MTVLWSNMRNVNIVYTISLKRLIQALHKCDTLKHNLYS